MEKQAKMPRSQSVSLLAAKPRNVSEPVERRRRAFTVPNKGQWEMNLCLKRPARCEGFHNASRSMCRYMHSRNAWQFPPASLERTVMKSKDTTIPTTHTSVAAYWRSVPTLSASWSVEKCVLHASKTPSPLICQVHTHKFTNMHLKLQTPLRYPEGTHSLNDVWLECMCAPCLYWIGTSQCEVQCNNDNLPPNYRCSMQCDTECCSTAAGLNWENRPICKNSDYVPEAFLPPVSH